MTDPDRPCLRPDVELLSGFDDEFLLHVVTDGRYVRLGRAAAALVPYFDGTRTVRDIATAIVHDREASPLEIEIALRRLVENLENAGLLEGAPRTSNSSFRLWFSRTPTKKFPLLNAESAARFIRPITMLVEVARPSFKTILVLCFLTIVIGAGLGMAAMSYSAISISWAPLISLALWLLATIAHESSHAVLCHASGYPVRSMGLALWYFFIPIAYADRTDTYRVRSRVTRVAISAAGPASDMFWCGLASLCLLSGLVDASTSIGQVLSGCIFFFLVGLLGNLNPLVPSDGQQALESALGLINVRNRAIGYLLGKTSRMSSSTNSVPTPFLTRATYLLYGAACCIYVGMVAALIIWSVGSALSLILAVR